MSKFNKLPSVFALSRSMVVSDAVINNVYADGSTDPVFVVRHGFRATQNKAPDADKPYDEVSIVQQNESAKTHPDAVKASFSFSIKLTDLDHSIHSCSGVDSAKLRDAINNFIAKAKESDGLTEVCNRYARNILNGRWLWRNRNMAKSIEVTVTDGSGKQLKEDALKLPLHAFCDYTESEVALGQMLKDNLTGGVKTGLTVVALVDFGLQGPVEVWPSQNYISDKPKGFARSLYKLDVTTALDNTAGVNKVGRAALRDQKIANSLRTIDTWYSEFNDFLTAIPVEFNGASIEFDCFFRPTKKGSTFDLMKNIINVDPDSDDGMFLIASIIRGGVLSESGKADKPKNEAEKVEEV